MVGLEMEWTQTQVDEADGALSTGRSMLPHIPASAISSSCGST